MMSLTYGEFELLICLHFPMAATGINKEMAVTWVKCSIEFIACHDKSILTFLTCSVCLLMMRSECG